MWAGGVEKDVTILVESDSDLDDQVDTAYRSKYGRSSQYVVHMVTAEVRSTTIKLGPQAINA